LGSCPLDARKGEECVSMSGAAVAFKGFPYVVTVVVRGVYHLILLPADRTARDLLEVARWQVAANKLPSCLVLAANSCIYLKPDGGEIHSDASLGQPNIDDPATGIRYGVISQHSINHDVLADMGPYWGSPHCPKCDDANMTLALTVAHHDDYACLKCGEISCPEACFPEEPIGLLRKHDGYIVTDCLDSDLFVLASPYFTYAQYCSPCVPGACNLDSPLDVTFTAGEWTPENEVALQARTKNKCYALGLEWFDGPCPYPIWSVATGEPASRTV
jgi:hypothetical protein